MKQNSSTDLLGHAFLNIYSKHKTHTPQTPNPHFRRFPRFSIGSLKRLLCLSWPQRARVVPHCVLRTTICFGSLDQQRTKKGPRCEWSITKGMHAMKHCAREKKTISSENLGNLGKSNKIRMWGVCGVLFTVNFDKRVAQKLRRIILLRFGLISFRFHFGNTRKSCIFFVFGLSGRDHDSQNQLF